MMLIYLMWSLDERDMASGHGWLERVRKASMASLVAAHQPAADGPAGLAAAAGAGGAAGAAGPGEPGEPGQPSGVAAGRWADRGGIDDDEHLAAYNAFLARLNQGPPGREK
jgi:hypothetical protein